MKIFAFISLSVMAFVSLAIALEPTASNEPTVELNVTVNEVGQVTDVAVLKSSGNKELDDKARAEALANWRFTPGLDEAGKPMKSVRKYSVVFRSVTGSLDHEEIE